MKLDIMNLIDDKGFTLLHKAASQNSYALMAFLLKFFQDNLTHQFQLSVDKPKISESAIKEKVKQILKEYIDLKTENNEGFTALHFAAFFGSIQMIKLLVLKYGADIHAKNT